MKYNITVVGRVRIKRDGPNVVFPATIEIDEDKLYSETGLKNLNEVIQKFGTVDISEINEEGI
jgi:hypothetical protein